MQKFTWSLAAHDVDKTTSIPVVTDGVGTIASQFESAPAPRASTAEAVTARTVADEVTPAPAGPAPSEPQALTRRELREREAKAAARPKVFDTPTAARIAPRAATSAAVPAAAPIATSQAEAARSTSRAAARSTEGRSSKGRSSKAASKAARVASAKPVAASTSAPSRSKSSSSAAAPTSRHPAKGAGFKRRVLSNLATVGAMAGVGLILISTTVPANAFVRPETSESATQALEADAGQAQELAVNAAAAPAITRDGYTVVVPVKKVQAKIGAQVYNFTNNPTGAIQWPFPNGSPISSGFGPRNVPGCGFCSKNHLGLDMNPGGGTPIQSIADGVVISAQNLSGGFGTNVVIEHNINGQKIQTLYAHMRYGSIPVAVGQQIGVGDLVGTVGTSGNSTGEHLHFELRLNGTPIDPFAWLQANAG